MGFYKAGSGEGRSRIPEEGHHEVTIQKAIVKTTKAGTGKYFEVHYRTVEDGKMIFGRYNFENPSDVAQAIGREQLDELCNAIGLTGEVNPEDFVGQGLVVEVEHRQNPGYRKQAEVISHEGTNSDPTAPNQVHSSEVMDDDDIPF